MTNPPRVATAVAYDLYLHRSDGDGDEHVWYAATEGDWVPAVFGMAHPMYPEYVLHLAKDGWARWLLKKTVTTYRGRKVSLRHRYA